jgi:hypothetical protein
MSARSTGTARATTVETHRPKKPIDAWIRTGLLVATGSAGSLWLCHLEPTQMPHSLSWIFLAFMLSSWPAYLAWRHCTRDSRHQPPAAEVEKKAIYHEGYVEGYLRGVTDRLTGADPQEVP